MYADNFDYPAHLKAHPDLLNEELLTEIKALREKHWEEWKKKSKAEAQTTHEQLLTALHLSRFAKHPNKGKVVAIIRDLHHFLRRAVEVKKLGLQVGMRVLRQGNELIVTTISLDFRVGLTGKGGGCYSPYGITPLVTSKT